MKNRYRHHNDRWKRHMASVPKGFLKYSTLKLLEKKPLSGSEIMNEIEKETEGQWKPSPGSIYPLLAWLQDKGYTIVALDQELGMKRYTLTDDGKAFLKEHVDGRKDIRKRFGGFRPQWFNSFPGEANELIKAGKSLTKATWRLLDKLREKYNKEAATQAKEVIKQATEKLDEISNKLELIK